VLRGKRKHSHNENIKNNGKYRIVLADWRYNSTVKIRAKTMHCFDVILAVHRR